MGRSTADGFTDGQTKTPEHDSGMARDNRTACIEWSEKCVTLEYGWDASNTAANPEKKLAGEQAAKHKEAFCLGVWEPRMQSGLGFTFSFNITARIDCHTLARHSASIDRVIVVSALG
jgi:hypothetical protein